MTNESCHMLNAKPHEHFFVSLSNQNDKINKLSSLSYTEKYGIMLVAI